MREDGEEGEMRQTIAKERKKCWNDERNRRRKKMGCDI